MTIARFGGLDVVVNNAGVLLENESWRTAIMVNTVRLLYTTHFLFHKYRYQNMYDIEAIDIFKAC